MKLSPELQGIVVFISLFTTLGVGYLIGKSAANTEVIHLSKSDGTVTKLEGYGSRSKKYGHVTHFNRYSKEYAEKMVRLFNRESWANQEPLDNELVELFYRKVK